jgi:hypothetical protein
VKFLSIVSSNLDEFFMVRVAGLKRQVESSVLECNPDGMTPRQQLGAIREKASDLFKAAHECLSRQICPALKKAGLCVMDYSQLTSVQKTNVNKYFFRNSLSCVNSLGIRSRQTFSAHLKPQPEPGRADPRPANNACLYKIEHFLLSWLPLWGSRSGHAGLSLGAKKISDRTVDWSGESEHSCSEKWQRRC